MVNSADRDHREVCQYARPDSPATLRAIDLLASGLRNSGRRIYVPAAHFGRLAKSYPISSIGVFTWTDRYNEDVGTLTQATEREQEAARVAL